MIFFFTGTGNSLYTAKHFDQELYSIPQEMIKADRKYKAEKIGIVCPLYEFDLPGLVHDFILTSEFETEYFYIVMTYGMHHGGCAARNAEFFEKEGKHKIQYSFKNYLTKTNHLFWNCNLLTNLNLSNFNTQKVTNMS